MKGKYTNAKVMIDDVDKITVGQITKMINNPVFTNPVSIMPDCHAGKGCVVGFTMPLGERVIPNVIGVDIGCGMLSANLGPDIFKNASMEEINNKIKQTVPMGFSAHQTSLVSHTEMIAFLREVEHQIAKKMELSMDKYSTDLDNFLTSRGMDHTRFYNSLGSLGGGNHFIEFGKDLNEDIWVTIHTGSRNFGLKVATYHQNKAVKYLQDKRKDVDDNIFAKIINECNTNNTRHLIEKKLRKVKEEKQLDNVYAEMEYLEGINLDLYLMDMLLAQSYAKWNRQLILKQILSCFDEHVNNNGCLFHQNFLDLSYTKKNTHIKTKEIIETVHNCIDFNDMIIRKGAISGYEGKKQIIPFNMRDGILLVEGKSNPEWNYSLPHGAGRVLSRSQAKRELVIEDVEEQMEGIVTTHIPLDEAPDAYKDCDIIEICIEPNATVVNRLKPIINIKG